MEIEDFTEDQFYQEEIPIIEIPENVFGNLIQLEQHNVFNKFQLPEDIWEDGNDVVIEEHNDIYNNPIYRSSDNDMSDGQEDGFASKDNQSEDSAYEEGWQSSENEDQDLEGAAGYLIDYNRINQMDDVWEAFILATRTSYLLGNHGRVALVLDKANRTANRRKNMGHNKRLQ